MKIRKFKKLRKGMVLGLVCCVISSIPIPVFPLLCSVGLTGMFEYLDTLPISKSIIIITVLLTLNIVATSVGLTYR